MTGFRYLIVLFFLVVVPLGAAADAVTPQWLDGMLGRNEHPHEFARKSETSAPLRMRDGEKSDKKPEVAARPTPSLSRSDSVAKAADKSPLKTAPSGTSSGVPNTSTNITGQGTAPAKRDAVVPGTTPSAVTAASKQTDGGAKSVAGETTVATASPGASDAVSVLKDRLKQLGASYMTLEEWQGATPRFRFYCRMLVPDNPAYARPFEATAAEPHLAVRQVLQDVETWRGGQLR